MAGVGVPVIAAGGIADPGGVAGALALAAAGVQVGTAYLLSPEATTGPVHRRALQSPGSRETAFTNLFSGRPARGIVNRLMRELGPMKEAVPDFPRRRSTYLPCGPRPRPQARAISPPLSASENAAFCREIPAARLTRELARDL